MVRTLVHVYGVTDVELATAWPSTEYGGYGKWSLLLAAGKPNTTILLSMYSVTNSFTTGFTTCHNAEGQFQYLNELETRWTGVPGQWEGQASEMMELSGD